MMKNVSQIVRMNIRILDILLAYLPAYTNVPHYRDNFAIMLNF